MSQKLALVFVLCGLLGCQKQVTEEVQVEPGPAAEAPPEPQGFSQLEWKIVDKHKALAENPELVEVVNDTNATGYFDAVSQTAFSAQSRVNKMTMEYNANLQSYLDASDGAKDPKPQSFEEFNQVAKLNSNNIKGLYPWQVYAYDEQTGKVCILEDRAEKKRMYAEIGREYPADE